MKSSTAILIFSRTAKAEARHKIFAGKASENIAAHAYLLNKTIATARETGVPYFHFTEKEQYGETFEERLLNSFNHIFHEGYENIICIGSDCPQLTSTYLKESKTTVERGVTTFGADENGGVYLIAISKAHFETGILENISWNTHRVFAQCKYNAVKYGFEFSVLSVCKDINNNEGLRNYLRSAEINSTIKWILLRLLGLIKQFELLSLLKKQNTALQSVTILRGPPACLAFC